MALPRTAAPRSPVSVVLCANDERSAADRPSPCDDRERCLDESMSHCFFEVELAPHRAVDRARPTAMVAPPFPKHCAVSPSTTIGAGAAAQLSCPRIFSCIGQEGS
jgi:hypothetical protein